MPKIADTVRSWVRSVEVLPDGGTPDMWPDYAGVVQATAEACGMQAFTLFPGDRYKFIGVSNEGTEPGDICLVFRGATSLWRIRYARIPDEYQLTANGQKLYPGDIPPPYVPSKIDV